MEENKTPKPSWKGILIFGIVDFALVLLATRVFNIVFISTGLMIVILTGIVVSVSSIKEDWINGFKMSIIGDIVGLLFQFGAVALYIMSIFSAKILISVGLSKFMGKKRAELDVLLLILYIKSACVRVRVRATVSDYLPWFSLDTVNFLRPLALRDANTRRPLAVAIL